MLVLVVAKKANPTFTVTPDQIHSSAAFYLLGDATPVTVEAKEML